MGSIKKRLTKRRRNQRKNANVMPILGIHSKFDLKVMEEIKPPFSQKEMKKMRSIKLIKK